MDIDCDGRGAEWWVSQVKPYQIKCSLYNYDFCFITPVWLGINSVNYLD